MKLILFAAFLAAQAPSVVPPPHRLKAGDILTIGINGAAYGGDYQVLDDGAIYGLGFGRVVVAGKTWEQAQSSIRAALSKIVRPQEVTLALRLQQVENVFLISPTGKGIIPFRPSLTLRQVLANTEVTGDADLTEVQLFRQGSSPRHFGLAALIAKNATEDPALEANDIVALTPTAFLRVWVTGSVKSPGLTRIPDTSDPYQAIAAAGGFLREEDAVKTDENDVLVIRRGDQRIELPAHPVKGAAIPSLQEGDSLSVEPAASVRFSVAGEVAHPSEYTVRGNTDLVRALVTAGGPTAAGTLDGVAVVHGSTITDYDMTGLRTGRALPKVPIATDDVVVVEKNERAFYVFGEVANPGKIVMEDRKEYRLSDALAQTGGLNSRGVLRRISVARPGPDGKYVVTQYNLDEFLKDGKVAANPVIRPKDMILFTTSRGITFASALQALSAAYLFQTLTGVKR